MTNDLMNPAAHTEGERDAAQRRREYGNAVAQAGQTMAAREWSQGLSWWNAAREMSPGEAAGYAGAGNALIHLARLEEAEALLEDGLRRFPEHEGLALLRARAASARGDWLAAVDRWRDACRRFPNNPTAYLGAAEALRRADRQADLAALFAEAEAYFDAAKAQGGPSPALDRLGLAIAKERRDWPLLRQRAEEIVAREPVPPADALVALAQACWHLGDLEQAEQAAGRALSADPSSVEALLVAVSVAEEKGDGEGALRAYRQLTALKPDMPGWPLHVLELLNLLGHVDEAIDELDRLGRRWPAQPMVLWWRKVFGCEYAEELPAHGPRAGAAGPLEVNGEVFRLIEDVAPPAARWRRPLLAPSPRREIETATVDGSATALLVFTAGNDSLSMPLRLFDRFLAPLPVTTIYLKDFKRLHYLCGVGALGEDLPASLTALRRMLDTLGIRSVSTLGHCLGAAAAIRYGIALGARRIIAASPPTHFGPDPLATHMRFRNITRSRLALHVPADMLDLKPFLEERRDHTPIDVYFNAEAGSEASHANRIAGAPGVVLHPLAGLHPASLQRLMLSTPDFSTVLAGWLGLE